MAVCVIAINDGVRSHGASGQSRVQAWHNRRDIGDVIKESTPNVSIFEHTGEWHGLLVYPIAEILHPQVQIKRVVNVVIDL